MSYVSDRTKHNSEQEHTRAGAIGSDRRITLDRYRNIDGGPAAGAVLVGGVVGIGGGLRVECDLSEDERVDKELEHAAQHELRGRAASHKVTGLKRIAARPKAHHTHTVHTPSAHK